MRQSLASMVVLLLLYAAVTTAQQNTLDSVVKQTRTLVTGEYKQQVRLATVSISSPGWTTAA
jgi:hypothetical protein